MRYWLSVLSTAVCVSAHAASVQLPGDSLSAGQQAISFSTQYREWQSASEYLANATALDSDDLGKEKVRTEGQQWYYQLTYQYGITDTWSVGLKQGFGDSTWRNKQSDVYDENSDGQMDSAGAHDLSLLLGYALAPGVAASLTLDVPSANATQATPDSDTQEAETGGEASGVPQLHANVAANWRNEAGTRWYGAVFGGAGVETKVEEHDRTQPWYFGLQFGTATEWSVSHRLNYGLKLERAMPFSSYSAELNTEVRYGDQSRLTLESVYAWQVFRHIELKPFLRLSMTQLPVQKFKRGSTQERIESAGGTDSTVGVAVHWEI